MSYKKKSFHKEVPKEFSEDTIQTIERIDKSHNVIGVMYLRGEVLEMYTVPEATAQGLYSKLPALNEAMRQAVSEIDVQNELVTYRIETNTFELSVAAQKEFCASVIHKTRKRK